MEKYSFKFLSLILTSLLFATQTFAMTLITVNEANEVADLQSQVFDISYDGQYVVFDSLATNLVAGDTNGFWDIFLYDREAETLERISLAPGGVEGNGNSRNPAISPDGRYVVYQSNATNLSVDDGDAFLDIFMYDIETETTTFITPDSAEIPNGITAQNPDISEDGEYIVFDSVGTEIAFPGLPSTNIYLYTTSDESLVKITNGIADDADGSSSGPEISSDGNYITYMSAATNLVAGDTNDVFDVFLYDVAGDETTRISLSPLGVEFENQSTSPFISYNGDYIVFSNNEPFEESLYLYDRQDDVAQTYLEAISGQSLTTYSQYASISADGRYVVFASPETFLVSGDDNGARDIFIKDLQTNEILAVSQNEDGDIGDDYSGDQGTPIISGDGEYIIFDSLAHNLVEGYTFPGSTYHLYLTENPFLSQSSSSSNRNTTPSTRVRFICNDPQALNYTTTEFGRPSDTACIYETDVQSFNFNLDDIVCPLFTRYVSPTTKDPEEIGKIQVFLRNLGLYIGIIDKTYTTTTGIAIRNFQEHYDESILSPWNLSSATGYWYKSTKHQANRLVGCEEGPILLDNGVIIQ